MVKKTRPKKSKCACGPPRPRFLDKVIVKGKGK